MPLLGHVPADVIMAAPVVGFPFLAVIRQYIYFSRGGHRIVVPQVGRLSFDESIADQKRYSDDDVSQYWRG